MKREDIGYLPDFAGVISSWASAYAAKNAWRVEPLMGYDDLMQDAFLVFIKIRDRYPEVTEAKHFMALFKSAFRNHIIDLGVKRTRHKEVSASEETTLEEMLVDDNAVTLGFLDSTIDVEESRGPVRAVLMALRDLYYANQPLPRLYVQDGFRETTDSYLRRIAGLRPQFEKKETLYYDSDKGRWRFDVEQPFDLVKACRQFITGDRQCIA